MHLSANSSSPTRIKKSWSTLGPRSTISSPTSSSKTISSSNDIYIVKQRIHPEYPSTSMLPQQRGFWMIVGLRKHYYIVIIRQLRCFSTLRTSARRRMRISSRSHPSSIARTQARWAIKTHRNFRPSSPCRRPAMPWTPRSWTPTPSWTHHNNSWTTRRWRSTASKLRWRNGSWQTAPSNPSPTTAKAEAREISNSFCNPRITSRQGSIRKITI